MRHLIEGKFSDRSFCRRQVVFQVLAAHVRLPEVAGFPVLIKQKTGRILVVLMQIVLQATSFSASDGDELFQLGFHQGDLIGLGFDVGHDGEFRHECLLFRDC